ncbi:Lecithin-cholesterol acyltransferase-like 1 [Triticum urartu]|uniref:Lecithin-cholesterol acyltransferase-like 1 n=1 Tax=Triticum urartu TaxID=4572 RepID=M8AB52_TRIUA|nr:Lecithin-cholesterol acyltransferase-like 1 [Triticum urartu]
MVPTTYLNGVSVQTPEQAVYWDGGYDAELYHPVILVPGFTCPNVEARLTDAYVPSVPRCGELKGKGWFPLWKNTTDLVRQDYVPCFEEQMRLIYDPTLNDYRNLPGVETRVPDFGSAHGFTSKNDSSRIPTCLARVREELELLGYRDGDTLFGAPYDPRHAPPLPGQPSQVYSDYFARVKDLVERASEKNQNKPVILVAHSFGGKVILGFVNSTPVAWRKKFIKHLVLVSPTPPEGFLGVLVSLTSGPSFLVPSVPPLLLRQMWRTFASTLLSLPSPMAFGHRPIVITNHKNYSAYDYKDFLTALGLNTEVVKRVLSMKLRIDPPMVPTTYLNGIGVKTPEQVVYRDGNFDMAPEKIPLSRHVAPKNEGTVTIAPSSGHRRLPSQPPAARPPPLRGRCPRIKLRLTQGQCPGSQPCYRPEISYEDEETRAN